MSSLREHSIRWVITDTGSMGLGGQVANLSISVRSGSPRADRQEETEWEEAPESQHKSPTCR